MTQKAQITVSFGTTHLDALQAISAIEENLSLAFPEYDSFRAFTSTMVIRRLEEQRNLKIHTPQQLLLYLHQQGYREILCQSLHIIPGLEYEKLKMQLISVQKSFDSIRLGEPLLSCEANYTAVVKQLMGELPPLEADEALLLMGHGTPHFSSACYAQLELTFYQLGFPNVFVGTVEGFPSIHYLLKRMKDGNYRKAVLAPFMIVAGDHAKNDLNGAEPDSWRSVLEQHGFSVKVILKGLGEYPFISKLFEYQLKNAKELR